MEKSKKRRAVWFFLFFAYTLFVVRAALTGARELPRFVFWFDDKFLHAAGYFLLGILAFRAFSCASTGWLSRHARGLSLAWCLAMALMTEAGQASVPGRTADFADLAANVAGFISSVLIVVTHGIF